MALSHAVLNYIVKNFSEADNFKVLIFKQAILKIENLYIDYLL